MQKKWLSFLICGLAVFSSTVLIFFFIPKEVEAAVNHNTYEDKAEGSLIQMLRSRTLLVLYTAICCIAITLYNQFNYLLPIQMDEIFLDQGAVFSKGFRLPTEGDLRQFIIFVRRLFPLSVIYW